MLIGKMPEFVIPERFNEVFFIMGTPGKLQAVKIDNSKFDISQEQAFVHRDYSSCGDTQIKHLITEALKNK